MISFIYHKRKNAGSIILIKICKLNRKLINIFGRSHNSRISGVRGHTNLIDTYTCLTKKREGKIKK